MKRTIFGLFFFAVSACFTITTSYADPVCPNFPYFRPTTGPLALVNCDFHLEYEKRIAEILKTFGAIHGRPVILNLGGTLLLKRNGQTETVDINPDQYHYIKTFGHAAFSLELLLAQQSQGPLSTQARNELNQIKTHLQSAILVIPSLGLSATQQKMSEKTAQMTMDFINKILLQNYYSKHELNHFFEKLRPELKKIIKEAVKLELSTLDSTINRWLAVMTSEEKKKLGIVVATSHQARAEEISLQYFSKKFNFHMGEGAQHENNFVVLEGKFDETAALMLLARHYLDREAAEIILNDAERLQRDLLADAAKEILARMYD